ncbi:hypothetical protein [Streptomyces sp. NPDC005012]
MTATKLRWGLAADEPEQAKLRELTGGCRTSSVTYEPTWAAICGS